VGLDLSFDPGQTPLSEEDLEDLRVGTITTRAELDELEQQNIENAQEWLLGKHLSVKRILSEDFIFEVHARMFGDVWSWAGEPRRSDKNIGIDWTQIRIQLRLLIDDTKYWIEHQIFPEDEIAIRFKHRLVSIHCFPNGNGRHSRLMADIIVEKIFKRPVFTWGGGNITQQGQTRSQYLAALRAPDQTSVDDLIEFARS
jgi:Fic-DOC domain mobile mystery protein B